ncbi:YsnF/AvaK domain-containing protein [Neobacillus drentensis]|uniref:YsnF/AvaK domain-containing protein n=1 Tax=Neobacillus drentensis TaxID=220684 RepID=UPI002FFF867D
MVENQNLTKHDQSEVTLQLHKEELQVTKKWVETADVTIYKKTYTEEKQILVPVTREELIIEKRVFNPGDAIETEMETIRIPLSEERIEVTLHPTALEEVEIYKNQFEELIQICETMKEEKLNIDINGDVKVILDGQS